MKFSRQQLDILLRLDPKTDDDEDQSEYIDITDEDYSNNDYPSTSAQQDDEESRQRNSKSNDEEIDLMQ